MQEIILGKKIQQTSFFSVDNSVLCFVPSDSKVDFDFLGNTLEFDLKNLAFSLGLRGGVHLRLRCALLHPTSGHLRRLRGRQVHEQQEEEDEADQGGKQQREKGREKPCTWL